MRRVSCAAYKAGLTRRSSVCGEFRRGLMAVGTFIGAIAPIIAVCQERACGCRPPGGVKTVYRRMSFLGTFAPSDCSGCFCQNSRRDRDERTHQTIRSAILSSLAPSLRRLLRADVAREKNIDGFIWPIKPSW